MRKTCPFEKVTTPCFKLKSLDGAAQYLRPGVTFEHFDRDLAVPALPLVSGADLCFTPISSPETAPTLSALTRLPNNRRSGSS